MEEENLLDTKSKIYYLIFHILYCLLLLSFLFFLIPQTAFFITLGPFLIIPLLFSAKELRWRFFTFLALIIPFMYLNAKLVHYVDTAGLVIFFFPVPILFGIVISHYILRYVKEKASNTTRIIGIVIILILIILFVALSIIKINKKLTDNEDYNLLNEIMCKGAYTTTSPSEIESLCNQVKIGGQNKDYWIEFKDYCSGLVKKIKENKYYFDYYDYPRNKFGIRNPTNYMKCGEPRMELRDFKFNQNSVKYISSDYSKVILPEVKDPNLCDEYSKMNLETMKKIFYINELSTNELTIEERIKNCYKTVAANTGDVSYCEKLDFPYICYEYVAEQRKDPAICDNIKINYAWNIDEDFISNCKAEITDSVSYCTNMKDETKKIQCYINIAIRKRDLSICNGLENTQNIQRCKEGADV